MFFPRLVIWVMENIREWDPIIWLWLCSISYRKNIATFSMTWSHTLTFSKTSDFHFCSGKIIVKISTIQFWTKFFNIIFDTLRRPDQHVKRKNPFWGGHLYGWKINLQNFQEALQQLKHTSAPKRPYFRQNFKKSDYTWGPCRHIYH